MKSLEKVLVHNKQDIIPCYYESIQVDKTKIRYDQKVPVLEKLVLIDEYLKVDLIKLYEYRNTVHLAAERKKQLDYDLKMGQLAFRRVEGLSIQLTESLKSLFPTE